MATITATSEIYSIVRTRTTALNLSDYNVIHDGESITQISSTVECNGGRLLSTTALPQTAAVTVDALGVDDPWVLRKTGSAMQATSTLFAIQPTTVSIDLSKLTLAFPEGADIRFEMEEGFLVDASEGGNNANMPSGDLITFRTPKKFTGSIASQFNTTPLPLRIKQLGSSIDSAMTAVMQGFFAPGVSSGFQVVNSTMFSYANFAPAISSMDVSSFFDINAINTRIPTIDPIFFTTDNFEFDFDALSRNDARIRETGVNNFVSTATIPPVDAEQFKGPGIIDLVSEITLTSIARADFEASANINAQFTITEDSTAFNFLEPTTLSVVSTLELASADNYPLDLATNFILTPPSELRNQFASDYEYELGTRFGQFVNSHNHTLIVSSTLGPLIYNISNPDNATFVDNLSIPGGQVGTPRPTEITISGSNQYLTTSTSNQLVSWKVDTARPANMLNQQPTKTQSGASSSEDTHTVYNGIYWVTQNSIINNFGQTTGSLPNSEVVFRATGTRILVQSTSQSGKIYNIGSTSATNVYAFDDNTYFGGGYAFYSNENYVGFTTAGTTNSEPNLVRIYTNSASPTLVREFALPDANAGTQYLFNGTLETTSWSALCFNDEYFIAGGNLTDGQSGDTLSSYDILNVYSMATGQRVQTLRLDTLGINIRDSSFHGVTMTQNGTVAIGFSAGTPQDYPTIFNNTSIPDAQYDNLDFPAADGVGYSYVLILKDRS